MKNVFLTLSFVALMAAVTGCHDSGVVKNADMNPQKQEREFLREAIREKSPDVQRVDIVDNTVVYTHIQDGIVDIKTYTYVDDVCVESERIYTFPSQMSALRHYRDAVEKADLYDKIEMFNNQVRYKLKEEQHKIETAGLTKEQLKAKFDKQIAEAKADIKKDGQYIENDMKGMDNRMKDHHKKHDRK